MNDIDQLLSGLMTPGPWVADGAYVKAIVTEYGSYTVAGCTDTDIGSLAVREANACLIAAAPDLLAALKAALPSLRGNQNRPSIKAAYDLAFAAIAKAEGRS